MESMCALGVQLLCFVFDVVSDLSSLVLYRMLTLLIKLCFEKGSKTFSL